MRKYYELMRYTYYKVLEIDMNIVLCSQETTRIVEFGMTDMFNLWVIFPYVGSIIMILEIFEIVIFMILIVTYMSLLFTLCNKFGLIGRLRETTCLLRCLSSGLVWFKVHYCCCGLLCSFLSQFNRSWLEPTLTL